MSHSHTMQHMSVLLLSKTEVPECLTRSYVAGFASANEVQQAVPAGRSFGELLLVLACKERPVQALLHCLVALWTHLSSGTGTSLISSCIEDCNGSGTLQLHFSQ